MAADVVDTLERRCKVECGYASLRNVLTGAHSDRMDSFWLAETLKYLYLTFADDSHWLHVRPYAFNTEAHVFPHDIAMRTRQRRWAAPNRPLSRAAGRGERRRSRLAGERPAAGDATQRGSAASTPMRDSLVEGGDVPMSAWTIVDIPSPSGGSPISFRASTAQFGPPLDAAGVCGALKWMTAADGCKLEFGTTSLSGFVAVAARGGCSFAAKAVHASAAGAAALIVVDNSDANEALFMAPLERTHALARAAVRMPTVLVPRQAGIQMLHLLNVSFMATAYAPTGDPHIDAVELAHQCARLLCGACRSSAPRGRSVRLAPIAHSWRAWRS
jgi:hypothetical protein